MEEADIRLTEVKKTQYEFKRDVVNGATNPVGCILIYFII